MSNSIEFTNGDIFDQDVEAIVNPVNCVGVMGKGLALEFRQRYPSMYHAYVKMCNRSDVKLGSVNIVKSGELNPEYIILFPTKGHWRDKSKITDVVYGLRDMVERCKDLDIRSVTIPAIGAGLGGLPWEDVEHAITNELGKAEWLRVVAIKPKGLKIDKNISFGLGKLSRAF